MSGEATKADWRALRAMPARVEASQDTTWPGFCYALVVLAVILHLTVSANTLYLLGFDYQLPGGNPLTKFHPASYVVAIALAAAILAPGGIEATLTSLRRFPGCTIMLVAMTICTAYTALILGSAGFGIYLETYVSAGVLALLLDRATDRQCRILGWIIITLVCLNAVLAIGETLLTERLFPIYVRGKPLNELVSEFRGTALYDFPLTGAALTAITVYLVLAAPLRFAAKAAALAVCCVGLLAFGGRTALLATMAILTVLGMVALARDILRTRSVRAEVMALAIAVIVVVPLAMVWLATETSLGTRIVSRLYYDNSANTRVVQWRILEFLDNRELLLGTTVDRIDDIVARINLDDAFIGAENFLLIAVVNLGLLVAVVYLVGLFSFVASLWSRSPPLGRVALLAMLIIASGSTSLATKSNQLFILVAELAAVAAFAARAGSVDAAVAVPAKLPFATRPATAATVRRPPQHHPPRARQADRRGRAE